MPDSTNGPENQPSIIYDFDPRNVPNEILRAIGLVTAAAAQTERILQTFIGALLKIDNIQAAALCAHMSFPLKETVIRTLAELEAPTMQEVDIIDTLLDDVKDALDKRNIVVHNSLAIHPHDGHVYSYRTRARGSFQLELKAITADEIEEDAATIYEVGMEIMRFMILRGIAPYDRVSPLREPFNRKKSAREMRRDLSG